MRYSVTTAPGVERRYRSGLCFTAQPQDVDGADMAEDRLHAILADPYLTCQPMPAAVDAPEGDATPQAPGAENVPADAEGSATPGDTPEATPEAPAGPRRTSKKGGDAAKEGTD